MGGQTSPEIRLALLAVGARFLTILKISDFYQKRGFWVFWEVAGDSGVPEISIFLILGRFQNFGFYVFWEVTGDSGIPEISFFLILGRFQNFGFFDFLVGLKIFRGRLRRSACGCQYDVRIPQDSLDLIMTDYIFHLLSPPSEKL